MMACGCAVIELASEHVEGTLTHGKDAWLVPPDPDEIADGIVEVLRNKRLREQLLAHGIQRTRATSWRNSARRIEEIPFRDSAS